jgi:hypothetical protein
LHPQRQSFRSTCAPRRKDPSYISPSLKVHTPYAAFCVPKGTLKCQVKKTKRYKCPCTARKRPKTSRSRQNHRAAERVERPEKRKTRGCVGLVGDDVGVTAPESILESVRACVCRLSKASVSVSVGVTGTTTSVPFRGGVSCPILETEVGLLAPVPAELVTLSDSLADPSEEETEPELPRRRLMRR